MAVLILFIMVIYVTMVYGPIAAFLVELFPTKIRYTSMSLPYHIGNGWFGGMLPLLATAIVAATGDIYSGLWYPIVVAVMTLVIGAHLPARHQGRRHHDATPAWKRNRRIARRRGDHCVASSSLCRHRPIRAVFTKTRALCLICRAGSSPAAPA